jgi:putative ABC transport system permease protein
VLSTLLLAGVQRQREFGMLGAVGMTPQELGRMILVEAAAVGVAGVVVGAVASLQQYTALHLITPVIIGYRDPYRLDLPAGLTFGGLSMVVAVVAALYPSRRAGKIDVLEALRYE